MKSRLQLSLMSLALVIPAAGHGATLNVPADHSSVQAAIVAASSGDTVLVAPGKYVEFIQMKCGITLRSSDGPDETTLVSLGLSETTIGERLIEFGEGCDRSTIVEGFTFDSGGYGGCGIFVEGSSPTLRGNKFLPGFGWCISLRMADALVENNLLDGSRSFGIAVFASSPEIFSNTIKNCTPRGIDISGAKSHPVIGGSPERGNRFVGNQFDIVNGSRNDIVATHNDWGWATTSEMQTSTYPTDISTIMDGNDRKKSGRGRGKVDYQNWVSPDASSGSGSSPWLVPILAGVGIIAVVFIVRRR